ncbi:MAG TPA: M1 family aminopeptidase [Saprospiraceae bacterium]|nr:M1 family aminopeptidase [Saprospiraceae bacterium]
MKKSVLKSILLLSFSLTIFGSLFSQMDLSSVIWDQDEIICKEQEKAISDFQKRSYRNQYAALTDIHYQNMSWEIDPAVKYIKGEITYYFRSRTTNLTQLVLDLSTALTVNSVERNGAPLSFTHSADHLLSIDLDKSLNEDDLDTLTVSYEGTPPSNGFGSFEISTHSGVPILWTLSEPYGVRDWWPGKQDLIDKIDSVDIYITTPPGQLAASNGKLLSIEDVGGRLVHHWQHRHPIVAYLVAIAVTNYTAFDQYVPLPNGDSIHVLNYVYPETLTQAQQSLESTIDIMQFFNEKFIIYPWADEKYGHAQFGWGGGEEHQTMAFMGSFSFGLVSHEMAHQWFGDKVTCGTWHDIWLNEGFATYLAGLCLEEFSHETYWPQWKNSTSNSAMSAPGGSVYVDDTTNYNRIFSGRLSYNKGAYVLHMLRWVMGDNDFFQAVRNYLNGAGDFGTTSELQSYLESQSGLDLNEFLSDWYYGQGYPSYNLKWSVQADSLILNLGQTQSDASVSFFEMPVPILVRLNGTDNIFVLNHTTNNQRFSFYKGSASVDSIGIDPDLWILSKNNTIEQVITAVGDPSQELNIEIYPNPAHDYVQIISSEHVISVEVVDVAGRKFQAPISGNHIDMTQFHPGIYTLLLMNEERKILCRKRIILS